MHIYSVRITEFRSKPKRTEKEAEKEGRRTVRKRTDSESSCRSDVSVSSRVSSLGDRLLSLSGASEGVIGYRTIVQQSIVQPREPLSNDLWERTSDRTHGTNHSRQNSLPQLSQTECFLDVPEIKAKELQQRVSATENRIKNLKILNNELSNFDSTKANPIKSIRTDRSFQEPGKIYVDSSRLVLIL